ncbi:ATP synthase subunit gamma, mitochondrial-like [Anneissia japonica]|uniref:ATP synthase subunit gamma, mitochondrial-like n=1 Tax=Anneissia japonica TaxID=1529436 RepID=UPI0014255990|nr:ATP synthase subunit gamma, mitochondrial-like [Anneissia japonica]
MKTRLSTLHVLITGQSVRKMAMLASKVPLFAPSGVQVRNMATLKEIAARLKSVKNIQKITKSMKMIAAARYTKAERELKPARQYGSGPQDFYSKAELEADVSKPNHLIIGMSSDRGLCGGIHSSVSKAIKRTLDEKPEGVTTKVITIGDKIRGQLLRVHADKLMMGFSEVGRKSPNFTVASNVASAILDSGYEFDVGEIIYNRFRTVISYDTLSQALMPLETLTSSGKRLSVHLI